MFHKENKIRGNSLRKKEHSLKKDYLSIINKAGEGTVKKELYEIFKDEMEIINTNNLG
ncbi:hypothetical protein [Clostridium sp.]|uniref:hypothetical protein n=1 Tax=Clostridium sp. TaxID=1506 RepID=UPI0032177D64